MAPLFTQLQDMYGKVAGQTGIPVRKVRFKQGCFSLETRGAAAVDAQSVLNRECGDIALAESSYAGWR